MPCIGAHSAFMDARSAKSVSQVNSLKGGDASSAAAEEGSTTVLSRKAQRKAKKAAKAASKGAETKTKV